MIEEGYSSTIPAGGNWTLTVDDVTDHAVIEEGAVVEVLFSAHLNEGSSLDTENANANTARLRYSNNPNPGAGDSCGVTAPDTVWVFTYAMENTKVDDKGNALAGAKFKLYADEECTQEIALVFDGGMSAYRPAKADETAETLVSAAETGAFDIKGLDTGIYYLSEIEAPAGYNTCADVAAGIAAEHAEGSSAATASTVMTLTVDGESATAVEVVNYKGSTLPSTGGMGTTLLYVAGGVLVIGAMALLVMRRRAKDC